MRWTLHILVVVIIIALLASGGWVVQRERDCVWTNRCAAALRTLNVQLELFSQDKVIETEKKSGTLSKRRAFYPNALDALIASKDATESSLRCPIFGLAYVYQPRDDGRSYFAYCPARHHYHNSGDFVNAVTPDQLNLHLVVKGNRVVNIIGGHFNPWDLGNPSYKEDATSISSGLIKMVASNPTPVSS